MLKNLAQLEYKIADKVYQLTCDPSSPLEHIKEALFQFQKYVGSIEDAVKAQQEAKAKEEQDKKDSEEKVSKIEEIA